MTEGQLESLRVELHQARTQRLRTRGRYDVERGCFEEDVQTPVSAEVKLKHMTLVVKMGAKLLESEGHSKKGHPKQCPLCLVQWLLSELLDDPAPKEQA